MTNEQLMNLIHSLQNQTQVRHESTPSPTRESDSRTGSFVKCNTRFDGKPESDVEAFIDAISIYKDCARVSDENALRGLPMLFDGLAATWWQGIKATTATWEDAIQTLRAAYGVKKPPYQVYQELFSMEHKLDVSTDIFVCRARALLSNIPDALTEKVQMDMIYGLINRKIRKRVSRDSVSSFRELLDAARSAEQTLREKEDVKTPKDSSKEANRERRKCKFCKKFGHTIEECRNRNKPNKDPVNSTPVEKKPMESTSEKTKSQVECYGCGTPGVYRSQCPKCQAKPSSSDIKAIFCNLTEGANHHKRPVLPVKILGTKGTAYADTGAQISVAGCTLYKVMQEKGCTFQNDTIRVAYADGIFRNEEVLRVTMDVELKGRSFTTNFIIFPNQTRNNTLLGMDFLAEAKISIGSGQQTWAFEDAPGQVYKFENEFKPEELVNLNEVRIEETLLREDEGPNLTEEQRKKLNELLKKHAAIFEPGGEATEFAEHAIDTGKQPPIYVPPYKFPPKKKELLKKELDQMLADDVIEECESPWGAPVVLVTKKDGGIRVCVDYRKLNAVTVSDGYPMPRIDELLHNAKRTQHMSTIDLRAGFHQVKVKEQDRDKTCFVTPFGTFRFKRMPFGLRNAPATFQRLMDKFLTGLYDICVFAYLDDWIIISETFEEHLKDLEKVFQRLRLFKLRAKREKCKFSCTEVHYLGHVLTTEGIQVNPDKVKAIAAKQPPKNVKQTQSFIQTCSWYRKFIQNFSEVAKPLTTLTKKNQPWRWGEEEQTSFEQLRKLLTEAPILQQADPNKPYILRTDASSYALGAVLLQGEGNDERPIEYASRLLLPAEINYSTTEREALAVVWAVDKFRGYLEGAKIYVETDHQPLKWLLTLKTPTGRLARWALRLQAYDLQVGYTPGKKNVVADMLSRPVVDEFCEKSCELCPVTVRMPGKTATSMREDQLADPEVKKIIGSFENANDPVDVSRWTDRGYIMANGVLYRYSGNEETEEPQLVVPQEGRKQVMEECHDAPTAGHYGIDRTISKILARYYFTGMRKYVEEYLKNCPQCQRYKATNLKPAGLLQTPAPTQRFETIAMDLVGPLPESTEGYRWIYIVEDTASKWVEMFPLKQATAVTCAQLLINEIFLRYGTPRRMISDNGVQFISDVMQQVAYFLEIQQSFTPFYHPESNPVERKNRDLKTQLAILVQERHREWPEHLPAIRFAMNSTRCSSTGYSAAYLTFGRELRSPNDVKHDLRHIAETDTFLPAITPYLKRFTNTLREAREMIEKTQDERKIQSDRSRRSAEQFTVGDRVLVKSHILSSAEKGLNAKLAPKRDGPYNIKRVVTPTTYELEEVGGERNSIGKFHSSDLTKFQERPDGISPKPVMPKRGRGRPRKHPKE